MRIEYEDLRHRARKMTAPLIDLINDIESAAREASHEVEHANRQRDEAIFDRETVISEGSYRNWREHFVSRLSTYRRRLYASEALAIELGGYVTHTIGCAQESKLKCSCGLDLLLEVLEVVPDAIVGSDARREHIKGIFNAGWREEGYRVPKDKL